jgi:bis(5'-nucleosyl)-tetraphosphatase (symmetrical)
MRKSAHDEVRTMAHYLIGDVQGCDGALQRLLDKIAFTPSRDTLFLLGDLVNRGPDSAAVLRRLMVYGASARCLLGNHDLHLLAIAHGVRPLHRSDTVHDILQAPDRPALLDWLRRQPLALRETHDGEEILMVHAGVLPSWDAGKTMALAGELEAVLRGPDLPDFLRRMYGNEPARWDDRLQGDARLRVIVNALTRLRFCTAEGEMEFASKEGAAGAPAGYLPWFEVPGRRTADVTVAFGHWSTLGWLHRPDVLALDTGCVWGGCLSAVRLGQARAHELIQVQCEAAQTPGQRRD